MTDLIKRKEDNLDHIKSVYNELCHSTKERHSQYKKDYNHWLQIINEYQSHIQSLNEYIHHLKDKDSNVFKNENKNELQFQKLQKNYEQITQLLTNTHDRFHEQNQTFQSTLQNTIHMCKETKREKKITFTLTPKSTMTPNNSAVEEDNSSSSDHRDDTNDGIEYHNDYISYDKQSNPLEIKDVMIFELKGEITRLKSEMSEIEETQISNVREIYKLSNSLSNINHEILLEATSDDYINENKVENEESQIIYEEYDLDELLAKISILSKKNIEYQSIVKQITFEKEELENELQKALECMLNNTNKVSTESIDMNIILAMKMSVEQLQKKLTLQTKQLMIEKDAHFATIENFHILQEQYNILRIDIQNVRTSKSDMSYVKNDRISQLEECILNLNADVNEKNEELLVAESNLEKSKCVINELRMEMSDLENEMQRVTIDEEQQKSEMERNVDAKKRRRQQSIEQMTGENIIQGLMSDLDEEHIEKLDELENVKNECRNIYEDKLQEKENEFGVKFKESTVVNEQLLKDVEIQKKENESLNEYIFSVGVSKIQLIENTNLEIESLRNIIRMLQKRIA